MQLTAVHSTCLEKLLHSPPLSRLLFQLLLPFTNTMLSHARTYDANVFGACYWVQTTGDLNMPTCMLLQHVSLQAISLSSVGHFSSLLQGRLLSHSLLLGISLLLQQLHKTSSNIRNLLRLSRSTWQRQTRQLLS